MEVIDTHMHINLECNSIYEGNKKIDDYVNNKAIDFFIPSINPKVNFYTCKLDCNNNCIIHEQSNSIVCPVICENRNRHRVKIYDGLNGNLIAFCTTCNKIIYEGKDPFREYNILLMELCKKFNSKPNLLLSMSNSTINEEIKFYEKNFHNMFLGYKLHPTSNFRNINEIKKFDSNRPVLIHNDVHNYDSINNSINFALRYSGNVVLAHSYLLMAKEKLNIKNLYFDICPVDNFKNNINKIKHNQNYNNFKNIYNSALKYIEIDKLLFGTDWPYGDILDNYNEIIKADIEEKDKQKILSLNAKKLYKI